MLGIIDSVKNAAESGIPKDYETAISSHKESIIWSVIKMETHNYVCDLVGLESTVFDCLSILCKKTVPLLDQEALSKKQVFDKHVMQHRLYTSSVSAVDTIFHNVIPLRTSRARQDKFDMCPCINSRACVQHVHMCVCDVSDVGVAVVTREYVCLHQGF